MTWTELSFANGETLPTLAATLGNSSGFVLADILLLIVTLYECPSIRKEI